MSSIFFQQLRKNNSLLLCLSFILFMASSLIAACIISNRIDDQLQAVVEALRCPAIEIVIGFNQLDGSAIQNFSQKNPDVKIHILEWEGYGPTKNKLAEKASTDWILSVDSDEMADEKILESLTELHLENKNTVYQIKVGNSINHKTIDFGAFGSKIWKNRLYNKSIIQWDNKDVHESLIFPKDVIFIKLNGVFWNNTAENIEELKAKNTHYAELSAQDKFNKGKKATAWRAWAAGAMAFFKNFFIKAGFLNGKLGWDLAIESARYAALKYQLLRQLWKKK